MNHGTVYRPLGTIDEKCVAPVDNFGAQRKLIDVIDNIVRLAWGINNQTWRLNGCVYGELAQCDDVSVENTTSLSYMLDNIEKTLDGAYNRLAELATQFDARA